MMGLNIILVPEGYIIENEINGVLHTV